MFDVKGKRVVVLGAARSGIACAKLLAKNGALVTLNDNRNSNDLPNVIKAAGKGIAVVLGSHPLSLLKTAELIVISPGIPSDIPFVVRAKEKKIPVYSEIETAFRYLSCPVIAVSGTNGKTTTTSLLGEIFKQSGRKTFVCGNIGLPISEIVERAAPDSMVVAEISSFQLENIHSFKPYISLMLNVTPDHLDRYHSFAAYKKAKQNLFRFQDERDFAILNYDDAHTRVFEKETKADVIFFSRKKKLSRGAWVEKDFICCRCGTTKEKIISIHNIALPGPHNLENALAAVACARVAGVSVRDIRQTLSSYRGVEHRLELVRTVEGVRYINDSKATNVDSVVKALESFAGPIILIAGGRDKGSPYTPLKKLVQNKVKALIVLGEAAEKITCELGKVTTVHPVATLLDAVQLSKTLSTAGDIVLLSPACASYDMFKNYEQRGTLFKQYVREL